MPRSSLATVLALLLLLALLELDLASGFALLSGWHLGISLLLGPLIAFSLKGSARSNVPARTVLFGGTLLTLFLASLALFFHASAHRILTSWDQKGAARLEFRAGRIQSEFREFLSDLSLPGAELVKDFPSDRAARFARLQGYALRAPHRSERYGWTLWHNGAPEAWAGRTALANGGNPGAGRTSYAIVAQGASTLLVATSQIREGWILSSEYLLLSPLESGPWLPLPTLRSDGDGDRLRVGSMVPVVRAGGDPDIESSHVGRPRHGAAADLATLYLPLRDDSGHTLILATLQDRPAEALLLESRNKHQLLGIVISCLSLLALSQICFRGSLAAAGSVLAFGFASGVALLVAARLVLLPLVWVLSDRNLLGPRLFGCGLAAPFFRSPADFFFTACFLALLAGWVGRAVSLPRLPSMRRFPRAAAGLVLLAASALFLLRLVAETPRDARFEITRVEFFPPDWPALLVQSSLCLLFGSWLYLAGTWARSLIGESFLKARGGGGRPSGPARSFAFVALSILVFLPLLLRESTRQRESFFLQTLLPEVENQKSLREQILSEVLEEIAGSPRARGILMASESESGEGTAYRLWSITRLRRDGLSSSLRLFAPDGRLMGRFGLNLPVEAHSEGLPREETGRLKHLMLKMGGLRRRVLVGGVVLRGVSDLPYRVQVYLLDEDENLSFIRSGNPDIRLFQASFPGGTNPELIASEPLLASFDAGGRLISCNLEGGTILPPETLVRLPEGEVRWVVSRVGEERYRAVAKRSATGFVVLGFLLPSHLQVIGSVVRFTLLGLLLGGAVGGPLQLLVGSGQRSVRPPGGLFRRLLLVFLSASLLPLFSLAFFLHQFAAREFQEDLLSQGLKSLGAAGRIIEDYVNAGEEGEAESSIDDGITYWVSRVVDQDINLYRGEALASTSTRELYSSGLLSTRLEAPVYRELLEGRPFALSRRRMGDSDTLTIAAPLSPADPASGILSLPLSLKEQAIRHKRADVDEAILIVTVGMLLLLTVLSDHVARRVSRPITALAAAAGRIEAGDYDAEVRLPARDEPALLIESFNRMAASLRRQREDLRRRSDYIGKILLNATTGVISTDSSDRIVTLNPAARLLLGLSAAAGAGASLAEILAELPALAPLREALAASPPEREARWQVELPLPERPVTLRVASLPFRETPDAPPGRILLLEDVTEAVRSSRLGAWAEMARSIAHEIKNPLTPIQLSADHLRRVFRSSDPRFAEILEQCLDTIEKQVRSLRGIAGDFSDYARIPVLTPERIRAEDLLQEVLDPYRNNAPDGLRLHLRVDPGTPDLRVDPVLTRRALINLVQNAIEAMPEGGTLSVLAGPSIQPLAGNPSMVRIRVRDSGPGMDAATRARLFEPYFSTKAGGTGLGLSIVKKTTEEQGGRLRVVSAPGEGTEVILDFPACET